MLMFRTPGNIVYYFEIRSLDLERVGGHPYSGRSYKFCQILMKYDTVPFTRTILHIDVIYDPLIDRDTYNNIYRECPVSNDIAS